MIGVQLMGGLGNQMFQYAAARSLAAKHGTRAALDIKTHLAIDHKRHYQLDQFNIKADVVRVNHPIYYERSLRFDPQVLEQPTFTTLCGYWQCEKYFLGIRDQILSEFTLKNRSDRAKGYAAEIANTPNAVSFHFRRRDAVDGSVGAKFHGTPGVEYYAAAALEILKGSSESNPITFFAFSDDVQWMKDNVRDMTIIEGCTDPEDIWLMSLCSHAIIANSTFSWWGAWLGPHQRQGTVIAPKQWFINPDAQRESVDICPESWVRL